MLIKGSTQFLFLFHLNPVNSDFMLKNVNFVKKISKTISKFQLNQPK